MKKKLSSHMLSNTFILSDYKISETVLIAVIRNSHLVQNRMPFQNEQGTSDVY